MPTQPTKLHERNERYDNGSVGAGEVGQWPLDFATIGLLYLILHRLLGRFIIPFMRVIAGHICLLAISMWSETVLYGLIEAME